MVKNTQLENTKTVRDTQRELYESSPYRQAKNFVPGQNSFVDNSPERLEEIKKNLGNYAKTSPDRYKDEDTFKKEFSYDKRSKEQKKVLDQFYKDYTKPPVTMSEYHDYTSETPRRLNEIVENLDKFMGTNPEMFADEDTFKKSFNYSARSKGQRKTLDDYFKKIKKAENVEETPAQGQIDYTDDSDARVNEIWNNLWNYYQENRALFNTKENYRKTFNYSKRSKTQKSVLDMFWKTVVKPNIEKEENSDLYV